jgi:exodeoxyribonuclease-3
MIASWNVNSIRPRLEHLLGWLASAQPEVVLLQETKVENDSFPREAIEDAGYNIALHGQKTYNGVAILSKAPLEDIVRGLGEEDTQARYIEATTRMQGRVVRVASVYVPNGQEVGSEKYAYKKDFLTRLHAHLAEVVTREEPFILGGDFNIAPAANDVHAPSEWENTVLFHPEIRRYWDALTHLGLFDAYRTRHPDAVASYSWWDYRAGSWPRNNGLRIDHLLLNAEAVDMLGDAGIDAAPRALEKPSDHTPVWCNFVGEAA